MPAANRFLVCQHMAWEGPGKHLISAAARCQVDLEVCRLWRQPLPALAPYAGLIILGGSPNVDEEERYPFLRAEKEAIRQVLSEDKAYLGFCLGHQLLAQVLGCRVGPNKCRSIGFIEGQLTEAGRAHPLFDNLPDRFPLFKWHAQAVLPPTPEQVQVLVNSEECHVEAISVQGRPHIIGMQFDNHAGSRVDAAAWLQGDRHWLAQPPAVDHSRVLEDAAKQEVIMAAQFQVIFENFVHITQQASS
ncbi:MAG: type 1 glutamine amidotransferase [Deltaproteobacteria bacterium]|nr:type 1 glutamine amidotransferase [Deltaproteobacteria bacterium]MBW2070523.1 type 1 glutamine amidotransferase [Deltaproteobacteria bacterium]